MFWLGVYRKYDDDEDDSDDEEVSKQMQEVIILKIYYVKSQCRMEIYFFNMKINVTGLIEHN